MLQKIGAALALFAVSTLAVELRDDEADQLIKDGDLDLGLA